jgi:hypothetical protein
MPVFSASSTGHGGFFILYLQHLSHYILNGYNIYDIGWGDVDWIHLAQDKDRWRALMNTVMNFRVQQNVENSWVSEQLSRAIAQAVSRWLPTAVARVQTLVWSSGICGGQSGAGADILRVLRFPLPIFIPPNSPSSWSPGAGTIGHSVADVPSGHSLDSTPHYANWWLLMDSAPWN